MSCVFPLEFNKLINLSLDVFELTGHCHQLLIDKKLTMRVLAFLILRDWSSPHNGIKKNTMLIYFYRFKKVWIKTKLIFKQFKLFLGVYNKQPGRWPFLNKMSLKYLQEATRLKWVKQPIKLHISSVLLKLASYS